MDQQLIRAVLNDDRQPPRCRAMALRYLTDLDRPAIIREVSKLAGSPDPALAREAVVTLAAASDDSVTELLAAIARDTQQSVSLRCQAIMSYVASETRNCDELLPLMADANPQVSLTAARGLTQFVQEDSVRGAFADVLERAGSDSLPAPLVEQLRFALGLPFPARPQTPAQWKHALRRPGDPEAGRRVFFGRRVHCSRCHSVHGRGGRSGPDLSNVAAAKSRDQILGSVLSPSQNKSPDYQGYLVVMRDGRVYKGTQFHFRGESAELRLEDGKQLRFPLSETEQYRALDESLMPEGLEQTMSVSEFRDLFAYVSSLSL